MFIDLSFIFTSTVTIDDIRNDRNYGVFVGSVEFRIRTHEVSENAKNPARIGYLMKSKNILHIIKCT